MKNEERDKSGGIGMWQELLIEFLCLVVIVVVLGVLFGLAGVDIQGSGPLPWMVR